MLTDSHKYYFIQLSNALSSLNDLQRCSALVALEVHSEIMIQALWDSIATAFPEIEKDYLEYFRLHVGGESAAEKYHVLMTEKMIKEIVDENNMQYFFKYFSSHFTNNIELCKQILKA